MGNAFYTYTPPQGWQDVTASSETLPQMIQMKKGLRDKGATEIQLEVHQSPQDGSNVMVLYAAMGPDEGGDAMLDGFDRGARGSYAAQAKETSFDVKKTKALHVSTQRVLTPDAHMIAVRYVGFHDGALTTVTANCTAPDDATCDKALATLKVDEAKFTPLADLKDGRTQKLEYLFGIGVGIALVLIVAAVIIKRNRRVPR